MIRVLVPSLLILASVAAMARQPRFLGPPVKKPADAGQPSETADGGSAADAGAAQEPDPRRPKDLDGKATVPKQDR